MKLDQTASPLKPVDIHGKTIAPNMMVEILSIPAWLIHDLPAEDADWLKQYVGQALCIQEIDAYGYIWFTEPCAFCLRPEEVRVVQP